MGVKYVSLKMHSHEWDASDDEHSNEEDLE